MTAASKKAVAVKRAVSRPSSKPVTATNAAKPRPAKPSPAKPRPAKPKAAKPKAKPTPATTARRQAPGSPAQERRRFRVGLSFADHSRAYVRQVARSLVETLTLKRVLYDENHESEFARPQLDRVLPNLYRKESDLIVVFLCAGYAKRRWCRLEWRYIRDLIATVEEHRIMLIELEDPGDLSDLGLLPGDGRLVRRGRPATEIANKILERLGQVDRFDGHRPRRGKGGNTHPHATAGDVARERIRRWIADRLKASAATATRLATDLVAATSRAAVDPTGDKANHLRAAFAVTSEALPERVASALLDATGVIAATALNAAHRALGSAGREVIEAILFRVLPFAADLNQVRALAAAAVGAGEACIELPYRTGALAELISAGVDELPIAVTDGEYPEPILAIPIVPTAIAPVFGTDAFAEDVALQLARDQRPENSVFVAHTRGLTTNAEIRAAVQSLLEELGGAGERVRYLLFVDAQMKATTGTTSTDDVWELVAGAVDPRKGGLRGLRLVRLRGGLEEVHGETKIAFHIAQVRGRGRRGGRWLRPR